MYIYKHIRYAYAYMCRFLIALPHVWPLISLSDHD